MSAPQIAEPAPPEAAPVSPPEAPAPEWEPRAHAARKGVYLWRFKDLLDRARLAKDPVAERQARSAVFVVHGMGVQLRLDTAAELRNGFEETLDWIHHELKLDRVAAPFAYEGYWADYEDVAATFPDEYKAFTEREQDLFKRVWTRRTSSPFGTMLWWMGQALRLLHPRTLREVGLYRYVTLVGVVALAIVGLLVTYVRFRKILGEILSDVRIYLEPRGDVERAIVQRIDRRVGTEFLRLFGTDWDFRDLADAEKVNVSGEAHTFDYVTWVAHSLGTVVSYNVLADVFQRMEALKPRLAEKQAAGALTSEETAQLKNIARVERGLHRFITMGSPLAKIAYLYPHALKRWPETYRERYLGEGGKRTWWTNFWHVWDPVSGRLIERARFEGVSNMHSKLWRVPGAAHVSYWSDKPIAAYILSRAYGPEVIPLKKARLRFLDAGAAQFARFATLILVPAAVAAAAWTWEAWWPVVREWAPRIMGLLG